MINMPLRPDEIIALATSGDDNAVVAKSFLGQSSIYWGIIGTFVFIRNYLRLCKHSTKKLEKGNTLFKVLFVLIVIQLLFSSVLDYCVIALFFVHIRIKNSYRPVKMRIQWGTSTNDPDRIDGK